MILCTLSYQVAAIHEDCLRGDFLYAMVALLFKLLRTLYTKVFYLVHSSVMQADTKTAPVLSESSDDRAIKKTFDFNCCG